MRNKTAAHLLLSLVSTSCRTLHLSSEQDDTGTASISGESTLQTVTTGHTDLTTTEFASSTTSVASTTSSASSTTFETSWNGTAASGSGGTVSESSGDALETTTDGSSSSGGSECNNGILEAGEDCDGTGGPGPCDEYCKLLCGNGTVDISAGEECDNGLDGPSKNGSTNQNGDVTCDIECKNGFLRAFVTNEAFNGNLGGIKGANQRCNEAAAAAELVPSDRFVAWLATSDYSAKATLKMGGCTLPYYLTDGSKLADSIDDLMKVNADPMFAPVNITEHGDPIIEVKDLTLAWSCNSSEKMTCGDPNLNCQNWTSDSMIRHGIFGIVKFSDPFKQEAAQNPEKAALTLATACNRSEAPPYWSRCAIFSCDRKHRLYCFEQCPPKP